MRKSTKMSKRFFKPVKKDLEWGPELLKDTPRLSIDGRSEIESLGDAMAVITIKTVQNKQPAAISTYNSKISEYTKELAVSRPDLAPKDRVKFAREMYKEWKSRQ